MKTHPSSIRRALKRVVAWWGFDLVPTRTSASLPRVLGRMRSLVPSINTVIDIGASDGRWSNEARRCWPGAHFMLLDAQPVHWPELLAYAQSYPRTFVECAAASEENGELRFRSDGLHDGSVSPGGGSSDDKIVRCVSIDSVVAQRRLPGPFLLKLDTHGHEREILRGARSTLERTELVLVEAYTFPNFGRMIFTELCEHMAVLGFRPAAVCDPMVRPSDGLLFQLDLAFLRAGHVAFRDPTWNGDLVPGISAAPGDDALLTERRTL